MDFDDVAGIDEAMDKITAAPARNRLRTASDRQRTAGLPAVIPYREVIAELIDADVRGIVEESQHAADCVLVSTATSSGCALNLSSKANRSTRSRFARALA